MEIFYYEGDPLEGSRWEGLSFEDYCNMSNEERQEFKVYLENLIDVPPGWTFIDEDGIYNEWMRIISLPSDKWEDYAIEKKINEITSCLFEKKSSLSKDDLLDVTDLKGIPKEKWLEYVNDDRNYYDGYLLPF